MKRQMKEGFKMDRKDALERVGVKNVTTHSSYLPNVSQILKKHRNYLQENGLESYIEEVPRLSLRRGKNIGDLVVNAKPKREGGRSGPSGKGCKLCKVMKETSKVKDKDGKELLLRGEMDCRTLGAVYGMWCRKCDKVVYVGKTMNRVMDRFNGHRADLKGTDHPTRQPDDMPTPHFDLGIHVDISTLSILLDMQTRHGGERDNSKRVRR